MSTTVSETTQTITIVPLTTSVTVTENNLTDTITVFESATVDITSSGITLPSVINGGKF